MYPRTERPNSLVPIGVLRVGGLRTNSLLFLITRLLKTNYWSHIVLPSPSLLFWCLRGASGCVRGGARLVVFACVRPPSVALNRKLPASSRLWGLESRDRKRVNSLSLVSTNQPHSFLLISQKPRPNRCLYQQWSELLFGCSRVPHVHLSGVVHACVGLGLCAVGR